RNKLWMKEMFEPKKNNGNADSEPQYRCQLVCKCGGRSLRVSQRKRYRPGTERQIPQKHSKCNSVTRVSGHTRYMQDQHEGENHQANECCRNCRVLIDDNAQCCRN